MSTEHKPHSEPEAAGGARPVRYQDDPVRLRESIRLRDEVIGDKERVIERLEEQNEILDKQRIKWERLAMDRGFALEGAQEQLETLRDVLTEAVEQLAIENEKRPNHNITLVLQRIALLVPSAPAGVTAPPDVDQGTAVAPRASGAEPDWQDMAETSTPASEPDSNDPRCDACGESLTPTPEQIRALHRFGNPLRRPPCLETENGMHVYQGYWRDIEPDYAPAKERAAATASPFEKPKMQQIGESLPASEPDIPIRHRPQDELTDEERVEVERELERLIRQDADG